MDMTILNEVGNWVVGAGVASFTFIAISKVYLFIVFMSVEGKDKTEGHPLDILAFLAFILGGIAMAKYFWPYF